MMPRFIWVLAPLCLIVGGARARADVLYTTFGPGDSFNPNSEYAVEGSGAPLFGYVATAMEFSPSQTATLDRVRFAALSVTPGSISGALAVDQGGVPGAKLETVGSVFVPSGGSGSIFTLTSSTHSPLLAGNSYWFILEPTDPSSNLTAGWNLSSPPVTGNDALTLDPAQASWQAQSNVTQSAFDVSGTPLVLVTPEPSSLMLLGLGSVLTLALFRRSPTRGQGSGVRGQT